MSLAEFLVDRFPIRIPATGAASLAGFRAWVTSDEFPEKWRVSFLNGAIFFEMSPEETETHNKVKAAIQYALVGLSRRVQSGTVYVDGVQLSNRAADLSTVPDAMYVSRSSMRSGRIKRVQRRGRSDQYVELEGTPDLVVEVISQSSRKKDTEDLPLLYHCAGIPEYWLIEALGEEIDFKLLHRGSRRYIPVEAQRGWLASEIFGRRFKLVRARDEDGDWKYELKVKK